MWLAERCGFALRRLMLSANNLWHGGRKSTYGNRTSQDNEILLLFLLLWLLLVRSLSLTPAFAQLSNLFGGAFGVRELSRKLSSCCVHPRTAWIRFRYPRKENENLFSAVLVFLHYLFYFSTGFNRSETVKSNEKGQFIECADKWNKQ